MSPSETINVLFFPGCGTIGQIASRGDKNFVDVVIWFCSRSDIKARKDKNSPAQSGPVTQFGGVFKQNN